MLSDQALDHFRAKGWLVVENVYTREEADRIAELAWEIGQAETKAADAKTEAPADSAKDRESKLAALKKEADDLNARFKDWTFVLPAYKYAAFNKAPDEFLKPLEDKNAAKKDGADAKKPALAKKPAKSG